MMRSSTEVLQPRLLSRIAWLLCAIVLVLLMAFCFFASSFCITLLLAAFLAILVDPVISKLERWHVPRSASAGLIIVAGMLCFGFLTYSSYNVVSDIVETMPQYAEQIREVVQPLNRKIAKVQETAGSLNPEPSTKKIAEVKIKEPPSWPSYIIRGVGPVWGAIIIIGVVPFLMFFNLMRKDQMNQRLTSSFGTTIDVPQFVGRVTKMVRGFAAGNLVIGSAMAAVTVLVLLALKIQGAVVLGIVSGFLNLIPFLGVVLAVLVPLGAALLQLSTAGGVCRDSRHGRRPSYHFRKLLNSKDCRIASQHRSCRRNGGDLVLGLVVGFDGDSTGRAVDGFRKDCRRFSSVFDSHFQSTCRIPSSCFSLDTLRPRNRI